MLNATHFFWWVVRQAEKLLDRGLHPVRIAEGFEKACEIAIKHLSTIADKVEFGPDNVAVSGGGLGPEGTELRCY